MRFASSLAHFLGTMRDAEVCVLHGESILDLEGFCAQLERALPGPPLGRRIDGPGSVTSLLRWRESFPARPASKLRYYIWHDADALLARNRALFGRLLDAIFGVAAEAEYVLDDLLLIHRAVIIGGSPLAEYARDPRGQFRSWWRDGPGEPFWRLVTEVEAPATRTFAIDSLDEDHA